MQGVVGCAVTLSNCKVNHNESKMMNKMAAALARRRMQFSGCFCACVCVCVCASSRCAPTHAHTHKFYSSLRVSVGCRSYCRHNCKNIDAALLCLVSILLSFPLCFLLALSLKINCTKICRNIFGYISFPPPLHLLPLLLFNNNFSGEPPQRQSATIASISSSYPCVCVRVCICCLLRPLSYLLSCVAPRCCCPCDSNNNCLSLIMFVSVAIFALH